MSRVSFVLKAVKIGFTCFCLIAFSFCTKIDKPVEEKATLHPFNYDLHLTKVPSKTPKGSLSVMICFHGMGGDYRIVDYVKEYSNLDSNFFSFNFPDYGIRVGSFTPEDTFLGSVDEILPALYVLKQAVIVDKFSKVSLYGFSAGGGAIINTLAVLNTSTYDEKLKEIGIGPKEKKRIIMAIQKGHVLLDAPLKSVEEMKAFHQPMAEIEIVGARFKNNGMEPIGNIDKLQGLNLHYVVNFQSPDEVLSNRDDYLYIEKLKAASPKGSVAFVIEGKGHSLPHEHLWDLYLRSCQ